MFESDSLCVHAYCTMEVFFSLSSISQNLWHCRWSSLLCWTSLLYGCAAASVLSASMSLLLFGRSKNIAAIVAGSICTRKLLLKSLGDLVRDESSTVCVLYAWAYFLRKCLVPCTCTAVLLIISTHVYTSSTAQQCKWNQTFSRAFQTPHSILNVIAAKCEHPSPSL